MSAKMSRRRALIAGVAAVTPIAVASSSIAAFQSPAEADPIFAAIENHRAALIFQMEKSRVFCRLASDEPEYRPAEEEERRALAAEDAAQEELLQTVPSTPEGALALLAYIDDLCSQKIVLDDDPTQWSSHYGILDSFYRDDVVDAFSGAVIELPFLFWVIRNARAALETRPPVVMQGRDDGSPMSSTLRPVAPDQALIDIENEVLELRIVVKAASDLHSAAETAYMDWKRQNPEPSREAGAAAVARWKRQSRAVQKRLSLAKKETDFEAKLDAFDEPLRRAATIQAASIKGLQAKARLLEINDGRPEELEESISRDLLAMRRAV